MFGRGVLWWYMCLTNYLPSFFLIINHPISQFILHPPRNTHQQSKIYLRPWYQSQPWLKFLHQLLLQCPNPNIRHRILFHPHIHTTPPQYLLLNFCVGSSSAPTDIISWLESPLQHLYTPSDNKGEGELLLPDAFESSHKSHYMIFFMNESSLIFALNIQTRTTRLE